MPYYLLDTSVAILLRDGEAAALDRASSLGDAVGISILTRIELYGGLHRDSPDDRVRRALLDRFLSGTACHELTLDDADRYGQIVANIGFSRRKVIDRLIAAQALTRNATLVTLNGPDFADVPGLALETWERP